MVNGDLQIQYIYFVWTGGGMYNTHTYKRLVQSNTLDIQQQQQHVCLLHWIRCGTLTTQA